MWFELILGQFYSANDKINETFFFPNLHWFGRGFLDRFFCRWNHYPSMWIYWVLNVYFFVYIDIEFGIAVSCVHFFTITIVSLHPIKNKTYVWKKWGMYFILLNTSVCIGQTEPIFMECWNHEKHGIVWYCYEWDNVNNPISFLVQLWCR